MNRVAQLLKHIDKGQSGVEIGPYHSPLVPRSQGFASVALDVFTADELRRRAAEDPNIPPEHAARIEEVDLLGSAGDIAELVASRFGGKRFDYVVSSHNFEHLPDPIRFLQGCEKVLKPGGVLSLAVPDRRFCFDYYRPATELSEWLDAHHQQRTRPTPGQVFRGEALRSQLGGVGAWAPGTMQPPTPEERLDGAYALWASLTESGGGGDYVDAHCSAFTPASFELLITDLRFLGLLRLEVVEVTGPNGCEFYAHMRNPEGEGAPAGRDEFYRTRRVLLHRAAREVVDPTAAPASVAELGRYATRVLRTSGGRGLRRVRATLAAAARHASGQGGPARV